MKYLVNQAYCSVCVLVYNTEIFIISNLLIFFSESLKLEGCLSLDSTEAKSQKKAMCKEFIWEHDLRELE